MIGNALKRQRIREAEERAEERVRRAMALTDENGGPYYIVGEKKLSDYITREELQETLKEALQPFNESLDRIGQRFDKMEQDIGRLSNDVDKLAADVGEWRKCTNQLHEAITRHIS